MGKVKYWLFFIVFSSLAIFFYHNLATPLNIETVSPISNTAQKILPTTTPTSTPTPEVRKTVIFGVMGDLGLGRHITSTARSKNDFNWSFGGVADWLQENEFNLANLESPIIKNCPLGKTGTFTFCGDDRFLPSLKENKFVLNLSNNHILNYSHDGLGQTKKFLGENNIEHFYSHQTDSEFIIKEVNNITFGFLGFDLTGGHKFSKESILPLVQKYDSQVDWLIVSLHWGNEYLPKPEPWRVELAHQLIDSGADIIAGHHPHVIQPLERYNNKLIVYSSGNFIFDQSWSVETSTSEMLKLEVDKTGIVKLEQVPIKIKYNSRPEIINQTQ